MDAYNFVYYSRIIVDEKIFLFDFFGHIQAIKEIISTAESDVPILK